MHHSRMATPRAHLIPENTPGHFHLISRCVRRTFLCGKDPLTGQDASHRKEMIVARMEHLACSYALEITSYAMMINHFHNSVFVDPNIAKSWSEFEVAFRWVQAYPPRVVTHKLESAKQAAIEELLLDTDQLEQRRKDLASISHFMKNLKGPLARQFNTEDGVTGAFWEGRFKSISLKDAKQVMDCLKYIDLNPHKAGIAQCLEDCELTTIEARIKAAETDPELLDQPMQAYFSGIGYQTTFSITTRQYLEVIKHALQVPP